MEGYIKILIDLQDCNSILLIENNWIALSHT